MVRIAYFGTDGCPGHHVIPIRGKFTEEDIKVSLFVLNAPLLNMVREAKWW